MIFFHIIKNLEIHTSCGIVFERIFRTKEFEKQFGEVCVIVSISYINAISVNEHFAGKPTDKRQSTRLSITRTV